MKSEFLINRENERFGRVWIEQKIKDPKELLDLQSQILILIPDFLPSEKDDLHMTAVHFGVPEELYEEFRILNPKISFGQFMDEFYKLLEASNDAILDAIKVKSDRLDLFGKAMVLRVIKSREIEGNRKNVVEILEQFTRNLGVDDIYGFWSNSPNLKFNLESRYTPHITLGKVQKKVDIGEIVVKNMEIILTPSSFGGVQILSFDKS